MFEYSVYEKCTTTKLATCKFYDPMMTDISAHMITDIQIGHEVHFKYKNNIVVVRPSLAKSDVYIISDSGESTCITEGNENTSEEAVFCALTYTEW